MSHKEDKPDYKKKTENLTENLEAIVNKLTEDEARGHRYTVRKAVAKLTRTLGEIKGRKTATNPAELMKTFRDAIKAHTTFATEVEDFTNDLREKGFTQLQEKRYTEEEIDELVNPKNRAS